jgi:imidazolonepropionase-like amidohydrolase
VRSHTVLSILLLAAAVTSAQEQALALKVGRILPISGEPIQDGVILIREGKIAAIGRDVKIPADATVLDASHSIAMPGLVDARVAPPVRGDKNEQAEEITPTFRISRALDPKSAELRHSLQAGVTTVYVPPGGNNVIAGTGAIIKPSGRTADEMVVKDNAALHVTMGSESTWGNRIPRWNRPDNFYYRRPTTRMAVDWMLRKSFFDAQQYAQSHEREDRALEVLAAALAGKTPIRVTVRRAIDIRTALRIADEYGLHVILDECTEGYKVAELIARKQAPVILGPYYYYPHTASQYYEGREFHWNNAWILAQAGVKVVLASGAEAQMADLRTAAIFAVRHGLPRGEALQAITLRAAEVLGLADRVGSLEVGKDADILLLSGDPLAVTSRVQRVILNGRTVHEAQ